MPLTTDDFEGFNPASASATLRAFSKKIRRIGEKLFEDNAVISLHVNEPGISFTAEVDGGNEIYDVDLSYTRKSRQWLSLCSCGESLGCPHVYAALQQLLSEYADANARSLTSGKKGSKPALPPATFSDLVIQKNNRQLEPREMGYLRSISSVFKAAQINNAVFVRDLTAFGVPLKSGWWDKADLWDFFPTTEHMFWNYLAHYLDERSIAIPEFLAPVTDFAAIRQRMRFALRDKEISRWSQQLSNIVVTTTDVPEPTPVELRLCLMRDALAIEWREVGGGWTEVKLKKVREFDQNHAAGLSAEAAMLWQPIIQRVESTYVASFNFTEDWIPQLLGRWLRQPVLRPFFVTEKFEPLTFHEEPLRWEISEPEDDGGDYAIRLIKPDGQPAPRANVVFKGRPTLYLTDIGVFTGPPMEHQIVKTTQVTRIPAPAFETAGGLRLIEQLRATPPPRLASRIRTVALKPQMVAELTQPWAGSETEYCHVEILGASDDATRIERWNGVNWNRAFDLASAEGMDDTKLEQVDRSALGGVTVAISDSPFKWDYQFSRWTARVTKKFPEAFVPFLQSLPAGTTIELRGELAAFQGAQVAGRIRLEATEAGQDWFDLKVLVDVNDTTLSQEEIKLLLDAKGKWIRLGDKGWKKMEFKLSEEEDKELARLGLTPHELTSEPQRMHALQLSDKAAKKFLPEETCARIERRVSELQARVTPDVPAAITAELRPYQLEGFHFLAYLSTNNFGGILADDMGLGKTVQTLAWIEWLRETRSAERGVRNSEAPGDSAANTEHETRNTKPSLVVCPKSVADNWHAEAARFLPGLKVKAWPAGELKNISKNLGDADLHVINYSQLRSVGEELAGAKFLAVILDEGQYIKNPTSLTGQMARKLRAEHRLVLSGTPIENRLLDLWSLMSFAMPGALGSRSEFGRLYDAKGDPFARQRLSARVRPFLIRRTKAQVARDLPDRVEEDLFCELEGEQKTLYRAELKRAQAMLLGVKTVEALNKQRFHFLTSLLRLRQICCHPKLVKPDSKAASAKIEALIETLEPLMEEGQKVLVFSQFVEMLDLIRSELNQREWKHWYLAGSTENRGDLVREFQSAEGGGVFLISLKAGGFGLNLTASSYVILFDPWWNPAVENQAIDRTHRIGQTQKVIAYRLLIKDSIEEKIRALQKQKKGLSDDVLGEEKFSQSLSLDDMRYLLAE